MYLLIFQIDKDDVGKVIKANMVKFKNAIIRRLQEIAKVTVLRLSQPEVIFYLFVFI